MSESKICVGDMVKVINTGSVFSTYVSWLNHEFIPFYTNHASPNENDLYKIIQIGYHDNKDGYGQLIGIKSSNGKIFIIEEAGIELINANTSYDIWFDALTINLVKLTIQYTGLVMDGKVSEGDTQNLLNEINCINNQLMESAV